MSRISSIFALAAPLACLLIAPAASAHVELTSPAPRLAGQATQSELKFGPCGQMTNARTDTVTEYTPGETITVEFTEYINHPGYFRVAFDIDGDDDFGKRADMDSVDPDTDDPASLEPVDEVILAYVDDSSATGFSGGDYSVDVTLPNVECDNCTLQLIQFMYDKVGNGNDDEYYYQCADIVLSGEVVGGAGGADGGGSGGATAGTGGAVAAGGDSGSGAGGDAIVGVGGQISNHAGGAAATGGAGAAAGGTPGQVATGGSVASGGATSTGGAGVDADGMDMGDDSGDQGGCAFQPSAANSRPFAALLVLFGLVGLMRRRAGV